MHLIFNTRSGNVAASLCRTGKTSIEDKQLKKESYLCLLNYPASDEVPNFVRDKIAYK